MAGSALLLDEFFRTGDVRFGAELRAITQDKVAAKWAERLYTDRRPELRQVVVDYVLDGCARPNHRPLVKGLFKRAEAANDVELMCAFLVAFDRWVDGPRALVPRRQRRTDRGPGRFTVATRRYLQRRAWRWFRTLGHRDPAAYVAAISQALARYRDEDTETPARLLAAWGLCHALWHGSTVLSRRPAGIDVAPGRSLSELAPAPYLAEVWTAETLLPLVDAGCRTVRTWAITLLKDRFADALRGFDLARVGRWLDSPHDEVVALGTTALESASGLDKLPMREWLALLDRPNPHVATAVVALFERHVAPNRPSNEDLQRLATSTVAPVAELGARWLVDRPIPLETLLPLVDARVDRVRELAAERVMARVGAGEGTAETVRDLLDARYPAARRAGVALAEGPRFAEAPMLWAAAAESPWDDVRAWLVRRLDGTASLPADALGHLYATTILGVARGGKARARALDQIAARLAEHPEEASRWLPLLRVALRGVRPPERARALAGVVGLVARGALAVDVVRGEIPELSFPEGVA